MDTSSPSYLTDRLKQAKSSCLPQTTLHPVPYPASRWTSPSHTDITVVSHRVEKAKKIWNIMGSQPQYGLRMKLNGGRSFLIKWRQGGTIGMRLRAIFQVLD